MWRFLIYGNLCIEDQVRYLRYVVYIIIFNLRKIDDRVISGRYSTRRIIIWRKGFLRILVSWRFQRSRTCGRMNIWRFWFWIMTFFNLWGYLEIYKYKRILFNIWKWKHFPPYIIIHLLKAIGTILGILWGNQAKFNPLVVREGAILSPRIPEWWKHGHIIQPASKHFRKYF